MRRSFLIISIILIGTLGFIAYSWILVDWYRDMQASRYERDPFTMLLEAVVIIAYCWLAFRFVQFQHKRIQPPNYTRGN